MRRVIGSIFVVGAGWLLYKFALWGAFLASPDAFRGPSTPFRVLGGNYPMDVAMLCGAAWMAGIGLYLILFSPGEASSAVPSHVPASSRWAQRMQASQDNAPSPMATIFFLNALLLITTLFVAFVGVRAPQDTSRLLATFTLVAAAQVAVGLFLLILALFEKPKGVIGLIVGLAVYAAGTGVGVMVFLWGKPIAG